MTTRQKIASRPRGRRAKQLETTRISRDIVPFYPPPLGGGPTKFNKQSRSKWPTNQIIRVRYQTPRRESEETWNYNGDIINEQLTNPRRVVSRRRKLAYKQGMKVEFGKHPLARSNRANSLPGALISSRKNISITFRYNWRLDATISEEPGCLQGTGVPRYQCTDQRVLYRACPPSKATGSLIKR